LIQERQYLFGFLDVKRIGKRTQNPPGFGPWGFDSPSRHHLFLSLRSTPPMSFRVSQHCAAPVAAGSARKSASPFIPHRYRASPYQDHFCAYGRPLAALAGLAA